MTTSNILSQLGSPGVSTGFKNRIINGAMVIDQRNAGASVTPADGAYTLDRWRAAATAGGKYSVQQNAGSVTLPAGFTNYLGATSLSPYTPNSGDILGISQYIEGFNIADFTWGTANAKSVTLSFQVYSSLTGTFGGALRNSAGNYCYPFSYTISSANTWTSISINITGATSGTWLVTNGQGIQVNFSLGTGSSFSATAGSWTTSNAFSATGATSVVGTSGATFYITGVQLEVGTNATNFDYRPYGTELVLCERYFYMFAKGSGQPVSQGAYWTNSLIQNAITFPVTMRITPSIYEVTGTGYYIAYSNGTSNQFNAIGSIPRGSQNIVQIDSTSGVSGTQGLGAAVATNSVNAVLGFSAEL
jgi:hypothetical protein